MNKNGDITDEDFKLSKEQFVCSKLRKK